MSRQRRGDSRYSNKKLPKLFLTSSFNLHRRIAPRERSLKPQRSYLLLCLSITILHVCHQCQLCLNLLIIIIIILLLLLILILVKTPLLLLDCIKRRPHQRERRITSTRMMKRLRFVRTSLLILLLPLLLDQ